MFIIRKNQTNDIVATASQNRTLNNPYYLFSFTHILSREQFAFIPQVISSNTRYDKFRFVESPNENLSAVPPLVTFPYLGQYYYTIYEQVSPSNLNPALAYNEVENGRAVVVIGNDQEPNCFFEQFVSDNETNENIIFISEQEQECLTVSPSVTPTNTVTPSITPTNTVTPTITPSQTPTLTPTQTPTMSPSSTPPLSFSVCSGTTKNDACVCITGGGTSFLVYAQDLGNCSACSPLNCWACLITSQQVYLDSNLTIPVGNGYYTNGMDGAFAWGTWNIIGGYPQGGGFSSGCP